MTTRFFTVALLSLLLACAPPPGEEAPTGVVAKALAAAESDSTLPPIVTHKGYKCEPAKVIKPDLTGHRDCESGFSATTQAEPGHCVKGTDTDSCKSGYTLTYKIVAHYDIKVWNENGEPVCRHIEEDKGLDKVADCR